MLTIGHTERLAPDILYLLFHKTSTAVTVPSSRWRAWGLKGGGGLAPSLLLFFFLLTFDGDIISDLEKSFKDKTKISHISFIEIPYVVMFLLYLSCFLL